MGNATSEAQHRLSIFPDLSQGLVQDHQSMLHEKNDLLRFFKTALGSLSTLDHAIIIRADKTPPGEHQRRFKAPTGDEVVVNNEVVLCFFATMKPFPGEAGLLG
jgi:hypothetical protein